jgi:tRNA (guanine37-N1)-methyltransferase
MKITILTLFPEMFAGPFSLSILKRAQEKGLVEIEFVNIRDFGEGKHKIVDDTAYGGGVGMVMKVDVLHKAIEHAKKQNDVRPARPAGGDSGQARMTKEKTVLLTASGKKFVQAKAKAFSQLDHLILICGHYEGIDHRIKQYIDEEISIGDFVLTGGELPSMLIADAVIRLLPGVLPEGATENESFAENENLLEYPHYTNPRSYDGQDVPEVLLSGNHAKIAAWKREQAGERTKENRPELLGESRSTNYESRKRRT